MATTHNPTRSVCPKCKRPISFSRAHRVWRHVETTITCRFQPPAPIEDYMVTSSDGEVTSYFTKAEADELWQACIHRNFHEPTHCATLTEGDTITGFYARVNGVVLYDSRLVGA